MKETVFYNQTFKVFVISLLLLLVLLNAYNFINGDSLSSILRAVFQFLVLMLIITKSQYAKIGIAIFSVILIVGSSISLIAGLIKIYFNQNLMSLLLTVFLPIVLLILGIIVYHYNVTTVKVKMVQKKSS